MDIKSIRDKAFAMPITSPAFPMGPYRFVDRESPVANLPVLEVLGARHFVADLTLGLGKVVFDYLL